MNKPESLTPRRQLPGIPGTPMDDENGRCRCVVIDKEDVVNFRQAFGGKLDERIIIKEDEDQVCYFLGNLNDSSLVCVISKPYLIEINKTLCKSCVDVITTFFADDPDFGICIRTINHAHQTAQQLQQEFNEKQAKSTDKKKL